MNWTRTLPIITSLGLSFACTRENPAFGDEAGGDSETSGESDSTTMADDASTDASTDDATDATDDVSTLSTDESTTDPVVDMPGDVCEGELRGGLGLGFADPFYLNGICPDALEMHGRLTFDPNLQKLILNRCDGDDVLCQGQCGFEQHPVVVDFDIGTFSGSCVSVQTSKPLGASEDICSWGTLSMFPSGNMNTPLAIAVTAGTSPVEPAASILGGYPHLTQTSMCECESLAQDELCCVESDFGVLFFDFVLPDESVVAPGETTMLELGASPYPYKFQAAQAQRVGDCGSNAPIDQSWAMWAQF